MFCVGGTNQRTRPQSSKYLRGDRATNHGGAFAARESTQLIGTFKTRAETSVLGSLVLTFSSRAKTRRGPALWGVLTVPPPAPAPSGERVCSSGVCVCVLISGSHLPLAVLRPPLELDVPVVCVHLGAVSDGHGHRAEQVQTRRTVRHLGTQEDFTAVQSLDTKHRVRDKPDQRLSTWRRCFITFATLFRMNELRRVTTDQRLQPPVNGQTTRRRKTRRNNAAAH